MSLQEKKGQMKTGKGHTGRMPGDDGGQDGGDVSMGKTIKEGVSVDTRWTPEESGISSSLRALGRA